MTTNQINAAIEALVIPASTPALRGTTLLVCRATLHEWNTYVGSEDALISAKMMAWFGPDIATGSTVGEVRIVEYPSGWSHEIFVIVLERALWSNVPAIAYLSPHGTASNIGARQFRPDVSYGPKESIMRPLGVALPARVSNWEDFVTIKVEIGLTQDWGERTGDLDWKAYQWAAIEGVAYVLCIRVDDDFATADYKLYEVLATGQQPAYQPNPIAIVSPAIVQMDVWRVLGLDAIKPLPPGFPITIEIDLYPVLEAARAER